MLPQKMKFGFTIRIELDFEFSGQQAEGIFWFFKYFLGYLINF